MALSATQNFYLLYTKSGAGVTGKAGSIGFHLKKLTRSSSPTITTVTTGGAITVGSVTEVDATNAPGLYVVGVTGLDPAADYLAAAHYTGTSSDVDAVDVPSLWSEFSMSANGGAVPQIEAGSPGGGLATVDANGDVSSNTDRWAGLVVEADAAGNPVIGTVYGQVLGHAIGGVWDVAGPGVWALGDTGFALASASSLSAVSSAILNVQNNTFVSSSIPTILERPDSGSEAVLLTVLFADETGAAHDIDASGLPAVTLVDNASTSLAGRLSAWTHAATGKYTATYTNTSTDALENIHWEITATVNSKLRRYVVTTQLVDTTAVDFTSADRTNLGTILAQANKLQFDGSNNIKSTPQTDPAGVTTLLARVTGPVLLASAYVAPDNTDIAAIAAITAKVNSMLAASGSNWTYTVDALKNAPAGGGGGGTIEIDVSSESLRVD